MPALRIPLVFSLVLLACRDHSDPVTAPQDMVAGIYVLRSVNGTPLPARGDGIGMSAFTIVADTLRIYGDGSGDESVATSRPGEPDAEWYSQQLQVWDRHTGAFDVEYHCSNLAISEATCIAPPHHRGVQTTQGLTLTYSVIYRVPLVYERVGVYYAK